jgi:hypothetical protein
MSIAFAKYVSIGPFVMNETGFWHKPDDKGSIVRLGEPFKVCHSINVLNHKEHLWWGKDHPKVYIQGDKEIYCQASGTNSPSARDHLRNNGVVPANTDFRLINQYLHLVRETEPEQALVDSVVVPLQQKVAEEEARIARLKVWEIKRLMSGLRIMIPNRMRYCILSLLPQRTKKNFSM